MKSMELRRATKIAIEAHGGERRRDGTLYVDHPLRMVKYLRAQRYCDTVLCAAALHDVIENKPEEWTIERMRKRKISEPVLTALEYLTHQKDEEYEDYIKRLSENAIARVVKMADLYDNSTVVGKAVDNNEKQEERWNRYMKAFGYLSRFKVPEELFDRKKRRRGR